MLRDYHDVDISPCDDDFRKGSLLPTSLRGTHASPPRHCEEERFLLRRGNLWYLRTVRMGMRERKREIATGPMGPRNDSAVGPLRDPRNDGSGEHESWPSEIASAQKTSLAITILRRAVLSYTS